MTENDTQQLSLFDGPYYLTTRKHGVPDPLVLWSTWRDRDSEVEICRSCGAVCDKEQ